MSLKNYIFTSESVSEGHPDKVCDRISDEIVDQFFKADPMAKVACETLVTTNLIVLAGEVRMAKSAAGPKEIMSKTGKVNKALAEKIARSIFPGQTFAVISPACQTRSGQVRSEWHNYCLIKNYNFPKEPAREPA